MEKTKLQKIIQICKKRGFVYPNSEIYGSIQGFYDYGPLGVRLKQNIKNEWMHWMTQVHNDIVPIDGSIITHPRVWEASGHIQNFTDPLVDCKSCKKRFRADHLVEAYLTKEDESDQINRLERINALLKEHQILCPECSGELTDVRTFNLMVETSLGVVEGEKRTAYLKGEACQTIYLDFENVQHSTRKKVPFGIVQIGKAFRNEITPGNFLFRQKEFEQWDLQWFTHPDEMEKWFNYWKEERIKWYKSLVNNKDNLRFRQHDQDELAHYAKIAFDIEYQTPFGWKEWEGIHWRQDWDLSRHSQYSGKDLSYYDDIKKERYTPWIVETSGGVDRTFLFLLLDAYTEEEDRVVLKLRPDLAPYKAAILPLVSNNKEIVALSQEIFKDIKKDLIIDYDLKDSIGKRYRKQDEIGTPYCITIDQRSLIDSTVTIRERDSMEQERISIDKITSIIKERITI